MTYSERLKRYEDAKRKLPVDLTPRGYEDAVRQLAKKYQV